jgi:malonyl-CoA O-methyltransferase
MDRSTTTRPRIDERALARAVRRLRGAHEGPWLHAEVARRMAERLSLVKRTPEVVVDWWPSLGRGGDALAKACPKASIVAVEPDAAPPTKAPWWSLRRGPRTDVRPEADVEPGAAGLVWSNMTLHAALDPRAVMAQWARALEVDGFLMFSTLGPGTLEDLTAVYRRAGWPPPLAPFVDMHDLGDMLIESGFADPVMDQEVLTLSWNDPGALLAELRTLGANVDAARHRGLRTPRWRERLEAALGEGGARPSLRFEVVYGHAFKPAPRARVAPETAVPLEELRALARRGRDRR